MPWQIDPTHASIGFTGKHMLVSRVKGKFTTYAAELQVDESDLANSSGVLRVSTASLDTGYDQRDDHLRSPDFFNVERYPEIVFRTKRIEQNGDAGYRFVGDLTIRDVTREVVFDGVVAGPIEDPWGATRLSLSAVSKVSRKDWGLDWNLPLGMSGMLVSDEIALEFDAELVKAG